MNYHSISVRRTWLQALLLAAFFIAPFLTHHSAPLFRFDLQAKQLYFAGISLRIDELFLVLLLILGLLLAFLLMTTLLGRIWCGWICPQTVLNDRLEAVERVFRPGGGLAGRLASHLAAGSIACLASAGTLAWFMPPARAYRVLLTPLHDPILFALLFCLAFALYLDLVLVRRGFCRSLCPYGRLQTALMDSGTLTLSMCEDRRASCLKCGACVKACPMNIDVRAGFQIECITCGRCIDACRGAFQNSGKQGLIAYRFGDGTGGFRLGAKSTILSLALVLVLTLLGWLLATRSSTTLSLRLVVPGEQKVLQDGTRVATWQAVIGNRQATPAVYGLRIAPRNTIPARLQGPVSAVQVPPNQSMTVGFFMLAGPAAPLPASIELQLVSEGRVVAVTRVPL